MLDRGANSNAEVSRHEGSDYCLRINDHLCFFPTKPLVIAMLKGQSEVVRLLLERGADPNCEYHFRWSANFHVEITPLGQAIKARDIALVKLLLEKGASTFPVCVTDPSWRSSDSQIDAQLLAARKGAQEISDFLEEWEKASMDETERIDDEAERKSRASSEIYTACAKKDVEWVKRLLAEGANPNAHSFSSWEMTGEYESSPALMAAFPSVEIVRLLLEAGADPNCASEWKGERGVYRTSALSAARASAKSNPDVPGYAEIAELLSKYVNNLLFDPSHGFEIID